MSCHKRAKTKQLWIAWITQVNAIREQTIEGWEAYERRSAASIKEGS